MVAKNVYEGKSKFQDIVIRKDETNGQFGLYLDGDLQFFSHDEYRYHEALIHPAMSEHKNPREVLILGGGDGLALREILKYDSVEKITLVDVDEDVVNLCRDTDYIANLNNDSLQSDKLNLVYEDARTWLATNEKQFDIVIVDFPDPVLDELNSLYTTDVFSNIKKAMKDKGIGCVQSGEIFKAINQFWCIVNTALEAGLFVMPYHTNIPSFGEYGFSLIGKGIVKVPMKYDPMLQLKSLNPISAAAMPVMPPDYFARQVKVNNTDELRQYYLSDHGVYKGFPDELK